MKILYHAALAPDANPYYGQIIISNIKYENSSQVSLQNYLSFTFLSPITLDSTSFNIQLTEWQEVTFEVFNNPIGDTVEVSVKASFSKAYTLTEDKINIYVSANLIQDTDRYLHSFVFNADNPVDNNGTVEISCADTPNPALIYPPLLTFQRGQDTTVFQLIFGEKETYSLPAGKYNITTTEEISNKEYTVVAEVLVDKEITIDLGERKYLSVYFGQIQYYSSINFSVEDIDEIRDCLLRVSLIDANTQKVMRTFETYSGETVALRTLPPKGRINILINDIKINNLDITFNVPSITLNNESHSVSVTREEIDITHIDTEGFQKLSLEVLNDSSVSGYLAVSLVSNQMTYKQKINITNPQQTLGPVMPGEYRVVAKGFIANKQVYIVSAPKSIVVTDIPLNQLTLTIQKGANLAVRGFPDFLCFGGCADISARNESDFVAARTSVIFKYAGNDGAGDSGVFLPSDPATEKTIQLARRIELSLNDGQPVLPFLISYTINLSLGDTVKILQDATAHMYSYANFILALTIAKKAIDQDHPVPAGFIVNPDFLGACQQEGLAATFSMPVRAPLQSALTHHGLTDPIPESISEDIRGYVESVNWLVRTVAPEVTFGWQLNIWGAGSSHWIYEQNENSYQAVAASLVNYINSLEVFSANNTPDFLAIDRYEADDFTQRAYANTYCYGPREWRIFYDFCGEISKLLKTPVMPWQIPASRTPIEGKDMVSSDFDPQHWGTSANYLFGDKNLNSNVDNIDHIIRNFQFPQQMANLVGQTPGDMYMRGDHFDVSDPAYYAFPLKGIFSVLLGGGSTTGIISTVGNPDSWVRDKLHAYRDAPVLFDNTIQSGSKKR